MSVLRVLDIGCGKGSVAEFWFKDILGGRDYELVRLDIDPANKPDYVHDIRKPLPKELVGGFDLVMASHILEHVERGRVILAVQHMASALRHMGELYVITPSLEWCAGEILKGKLTAGVQACIYGGPEPDMANGYYHHTGFTLEWLRWLIENPGGLILRQARQTEFDIHMTAADGETRDYTGVQNVVIGAKYVDDPVEAIG
jgi:SAM-dependent methyltransferase